MEKVETIKFVVAADMEFVGRVKDLDRRDIQDYLEYHARKAVSKALEQLYDDNLSLKKLGFS